MFDVPPPMSDRPPEASTAAPMQRAAGRAAVGLRADGGRMRLSGLHQSGAAKAFLPRNHAPVPEVVFLNTAGGLTGGDALSYTVELGPGAQALATTQTAERAYAASGGIARLNVDLRLGRDARLDWLPQETILYDGAALARTTRAELAPGARILMAEMIVFGRAAMGEVVTRLSFSDRREIWRGGRPVMIDPLAIDGPSLDPAHGPRAALLDGARAIATVALLGEGAEDAAETLRAALAGAESVIAAVSGWDGRCILRIRAADALPLKRAVARAIGILRGGAPLPRVWQI